MAKRVAPLTAAGIAKLKPDPARTIETVDGAVPGLRLRITPSGTRTWSLNMRARGVMRRFDVGAHLGLAEARLRAQALRRRIADGADPTAERRLDRKMALGAKQGIGTFDSVVDAYFETGSGAGLKTKVEQQKRIKSVFAEHLARPAPDITSPELQITIDRHPAKVAAARAVAYLRPAIRWAVKRNFMQGAFDIEKPVLKSAAQRVLSDDELAMLIPHFNDDYGRCCRFLVLTGARLDEARNATWAQVDVDAGNWTIPAQQRKDSRGAQHRGQAAKSDLVIPLSRQAREVLAEARLAEEARRKLARSSAPIAHADPVFVGSRGGKLINWDRWLKITARKTGVSGWSAHALRRTTATLSGEIGTPPHIVSVILGHANIGGQLVAGYNKSRYRAEHGVALQCVADHLDAVVHSERA